MIYDKIANFNKYLPILKEYGIETNILVNISTHQNITYIQKDYDYTFIEMKVFEFHDRDIDIHHVLKGSEKIDVTNKPNKHFQYEASDCYLFINEGEYSSITLHKDEFIIFLPGECHRINPSNKNLVKKKIIKLKTK